MYMFVIQHVVCIETFLLASVSFPLCVLSFLFVSTMATFGVFQIDSDYKTKPLRLIQEFDEKWVENNPLPAQCSVWTDFGEVPSTVIFIGSKYVSICNNLTQFVFFKHWMNAIHTSLAWKIHVF